MTMTIAVAGKGGTGKTTFVALLIKYIRSHDLGYTIAVDGDPSTNLSMVLGMDLEETVGHIREAMSEEVQSGRYDVSIPKARFLEYRINESLVEGDRIDLIAMGQPEGPGCYCAANNILRDVIDRLKDEYDYVVVDNEAGMEHISRQTTRRVDKLFVVSDLTMRGLDAAGRIAKLVEELGTRVRDMYLVINRVKNGVPPPIQDKVEELGLSIFRTLPEDDTVSEFDMLGRPIFQIEEDAPVYRALAELAMDAGIK
jgi:CO dehydrogenase maturation factor